MRSPVHLELGWRMLVRSFAEARTDLASAEIRRVHLGDRVVVSGELVMERIDGPIEDDLSAVRAWIKATSVSAESPHPDAQ